MLLKSSMLILIALLVSRFSGYLFHSLFAKSFSTEEYGLFVYLWYLSMLIAGVGLFGVAAAAARFIAFSRGSGDEKKASDYFKTGLVLNFTFMIACIVGVVLLNVALSLDFFSLAFICFFIAIHALGFYFGSAIAGYKEPVVTNCNMAFGQVSKALLLAVVVYITLGFGYALLAFLLAALLGYVSNAVYFIRKYGMNGTFRVELAWELVRFGFFVVLTDTSNNVASWAGIFILQYLLGYSLVAVYNAAYMISAVSLILFVAVTDIYSPVVTELLGRKDYAKCSRLSSHLIESFLLLFLPPFVVLFLFSGEVLSLIFTPDYVQAASALKILLIAAFVYGAATLLRKFIVADGRPNDEARVMVISSFANLVLSYFLVQSYKLDGAALALLLSSAVMFLLSLRYLGSKIRLQVSMPRVVKIAVAIIASSLVVYVIKYFAGSSIASLISSSIVLCVVYAMVLLLLKSLRPEDVEVVELVADKANLPASLRNPLISALKNGVSD
ncbi:MAG: polysaccharide biosynthesis C-terminal domain-containing protein [Candidatus Altiarchaeota archaeon]|nr:polysaccharide biosynthesis C-terminal domain-containing protein [Candidatus Altiarchaeota archaeon]